MSFEDLLFSYTGRIRRSHWWVAKLCLAPATFGLAFVMGSLQATFVAKHDLIDLSLIGLAFLIVFLILAWVSLAVSVKRLHDLNWTGWLVLVGFVPLVGGLFELICMGVLEGTPGPNNFGPSPKFEERETEVFA